MKKKRASKEKAEKRPVGRPRINGERFTARLPDGTNVRIRRALLPGEDQASFLRAAILQELKARGA